MSLPGPTSKRRLFRKFFSRGSTQTSNLTLPQSPITSATPSPTRTSTTTPQTFEDRVFEKLSQQEQDTIRRHVAPNAAIGTLVQQALDMTQHKQEICQAKRWTVIFRGRTVVLREKADNIVKWLDRFKQVGDVASNADPVLIGPPWAGIRLLLEVSVAIKREETRQRLDC
jgi:hypothetical protein